MKTALIATTLVTASAIPKMNKLFHSELSIVAKHAKTDKMNANVVRSKAVTDKVIKEDDIDKHGQLNVESHNYMNNFEIAAGVVGCSGDDRIETFSVQTGHCWDGIWDGGDGYPESLMLFKPYNYGFPLYALFMGHGCNWNDAYWYGRVPKRQFFDMPGDYQPCKN